MESLHNYVAALVLDEKLLFLFFTHHFFSKQNETAFIRDQYCHLSDDGSPLHWLFSTLQLPKHSFYFNFVSDQFNKCEI